MSINFSPSRLKNNVYEPVGNYIDVNCWLCKGTGKEQDYDGSIIACELCKGTGKQKEVDQPEMNLSNTNAGAVLSFLGYPQDYSGVIPNQDLQKHLMRMYQIQKMDEPSGLESPGHIQRPVKAVVKDPNTGVPTITKQGATIYHMGRTPQQVKSYINKLIEIFEFAKKNNAVVTWA